MLADSALCVTIALGNHTWGHGRRSRHRREAGAHETDLDGTDHTTATAPALIEDILDIVQRASAITGNTGEEFVAC